jgi:hypothetical protein
MPSLLIYIPPVIYVMNVSNSFSLLLMSKVNLSKNIKNNLEERGHKISENSGLDVAVRVSANKPGHRQERMTSEVNEALFVNIKEKRSLNTAPTLLQRDQSLLTSDCVFFSNNKPSNQETTESCLPFSRFFGNLI